MSKLSSFASKVGAGVLSIATLAGSLALSAAPADAGPRHRHHGHHHGHHRGAWVAPAVVGGLVLGGLAAQSHYYTPAHRCWIEPRRVVNRYGHVVVRRVQVCG